MPPFDIQTKFHGLNSRISDVLDILIPDDILGRPTKKSNSRDWSPHTVTSAFTMLLLSRYDTGRSPPSAQKIKQQKLLTVLASSSIAG